MTDQPGRRGTGTRRDATPVGAAISAALLLAYALYRPESLEFSVPFLIGPALALMWSKVWDGPEADRRLARAVTFGIAIGVAVVAAITLLR